MLIQKDSTLLAIALIVSLFLLTGCEIYKNVVPPETMQGTWIGLGQVQLSNEYMNQREMPFFFTIEENGAISGFVGDAVMNNAMFSKPLWLYGLFVKDKYRSKFNLQGNIVNKEQFRRDGGTIIFHDSKDDELNCSFTSTGSKADTKNLVLTVTDIKLRRTRQ